MSSYVREMTAAQIREGPDRITVAFLESARFYTLATDHPSFARILEALTRSMAEHRPVRVTLPAIDAGTIDDVATE
jgi:hypothetical protein